MRDRIRGAMGLIVNRKNKLQPVPKYRMFDGEIRGGAIFGRRANRRLYTRQDSFLVINQDPWREVGNDIRDAMNDFADIVMTAEKHR